METTELREAVTAAEKAISRAERALEKVKNAVHELDLIVDQQEETEALGIA